MNTPRKTALITGASSGIGRALASLIAADGHDVVLIARSQDKLEALAAELRAAYNTSCSIMAEDLADPEAPERILHSLGESGTHIDILVNNAGYGLFGQFADTSLDSERDMIQVNVVSLMELTKRLLPHMIAAGEGRVLNVASTAAFQPGPLMAIYYATKSFVLSFSEAIANELQGTGVTVTALCPGPTASGFQESAKMEDSKLVRGKRLPTAEEVAWAGYRAMKKGKRVYVHGAKNRFLAWSVRFMPRNMVTATVRRTQEAAPS